MLIPGPPPPKPEEYYALYNGKRYHGRLIKGKPTGPKSCLSSPGFRKEFVRFARAYFDILEAPAVSVMLADGYTQICECDLCKGKESPELGPVGMLSNYAWGFANDIARELYKTHPDKVVLAGSYGSYREAPNNIKKFSPNLVAHITQQRMTFLQKPEDKARYLKYRNSLMKLMGREKNAILFYEYYRGTNHTPHFNPHPIAEDIKSVKGIGMGDVIRISRDINFKKNDTSKLRQRMSVQHLDLYITGRFLWNADLDVENVLDEYYKRFYGPAASEMKDLVEYGEKIWMKIMSDKKYVEKTMNLLKAAMNKVDTESVYGKRLALLNAYLTPMEENMAKLVAIQSVERADDNPDYYILDSRRLPVNLDGVLDEPFWDKKNLKHYSRGELMERKTGKRNNKNRTFLKVGYYQNSLYIGIQARRTEDIDLNKSIENDSPDIWKGEYYDILLEPVGHSYYQISINPAGAVTDLDKSLKENDQINWTADAVVKTSMDDKNWYAEIKIPIAGEDQSFILPYEGVAGNKPTQRLPWFFNVIRYIPQKDGSTLILEASPSFTDDAEHHRDRFSKLCTGRPNPRKYNWSMKTHKASKKDDQ